MTETLTLAAAARMMRDALRDRSYRATPLGREVARYYRWKKNEWGATAPIRCASPLSAGSWSIGAG